MNTQTIIFCVVAIGAFFLVLGFSVIAPWIRALMAGAKAPMIEILITRFLYPMESERVIDGYVLLRKENVEIELKEVRNLYKEGPSFFTESCTQLILSRRKEKT